MTTGRLRLIAAFCALVAMSAPVYAQLFGPAVTTTNVNLRQGPGSREAVISVLRPGEEVNVSRCANNWCLVDVGRDRGWVSQPYLRRLIDRPVPPAPDVNQGTSIACFYERPHFGGSSFCLRPGDSQRDLGSWRGKIASVSVEGPSTSVDLCTVRNLMNCTNIIRDTPLLGRNLAGAIVSVRVW